ncbi:MAG: carboxypeptidase-like regulatory domain-containing protein [Vicinamibacterales bacterium]
MRLSARTFAAALFVLLAMSSGGSRLAAAERRVRGVVADESGGVLPGVTVVAISPDGQVLATVVSDGAGAYTLGPLAAARVRLTFQLEGFTTASFQVTVTEADTSVNQRLVIAPQSETVLVYAKAPVEAKPAPPPLPPPPPRPRPPTNAVPEHDRDSICGPAKLADLESFGMLQSRRYAANGLYAQGDELVVTGGTATGLAVGRNLVVRRSYRGDADSIAPTAEHTSGLVQIVEAGEFASVAVVMYACDEMMVGDRLASFKPEPVRSPEPAGVPAYDQAAKILFADAGQLLGMPRRLMVIDRGASSGLRAGQRLTLFRRRLTAEHAVVITGDGVIVATRGDSATIRVEHATDAIGFGDWAAPHQPSPAVR